MTPQSENTGAPAKLRRGPLFPHSEHRARIYLDGQSFCGFRDSSMQVSLSTSSDA